MNEAVGQRRYTGTSSSSGFDMNKTLVILLAAAFCGQAAPADPVSHSASHEVMTIAGEAVSQSLQANIPVDADDPERLQPSTRGAPPIDAPSRGRLRALMQYHPREDCGVDDGMRLVILDGDRQIYSHDYCSTYALGRTHLVTDLSGRHYVLLEYGSGHGTHATSIYLEIFEFTGALQERARIPVSEPIGIGADSTYDYRVSTPTGGGMIVSGHWSVTGDRGPYDVSLPRTVTLLEIDTTPRTDQ